MTSSGGEDFPASLLLVGAGRMGAALLQGWLNLGLDPARVHVLDPALSAEMQAFCTARGVGLGAPAQPAEVLVLAIKPQIFVSAAPALASLVDPDTLVVSILAGKTLQGIADHLPGARAIVRAMPNLPAAIGAGITGAVANAAVSPKQKATAQALLEAGGAVVWLDDEGLIDAVTAVSGSGPAYVFLSGRMSDQGWCRPGASLRCRRATGTCDDRGRRCIARCHARGLGGKITRRCHLARGHDRSGSQGIDGRRRFGRSHRPCSGGSPP